MASSYSDRLALELQAAGENLDTWGDPRLNNDLIRVDFATKGVVSFTLSGNKTLTSSNTSSSNTALYENIGAVLNITSGTGGNITIPSKAGVWVVRNATTGNVVITNGSNSVTVTKGSVLSVFTDGTNVYKGIPESGAITYATGTWTPVASFATPGTSSWAYTEAVGSYTRIGDRVTVDCRLSATPTKGTASGAFLVTGLPFAANALDVSTSIPKTLSADFIWPASRTEALIGFNNTTSLILIGRGGGVSDTTFTVANLSLTSHKLYFSLTYRV